MDDRRFDSLVKSLASGRNRRTVLKGLLGLGAVATAGTLSSGHADAARRPTPTPTIPKCPSGQHWDGSACACNTGAKCGSDCCQAGSVCCDNACCYGECYGEELCCPTGQIVCNGECLPIGVECNADNCCTGEDVCIEGTCQAACAGTGGSCSGNEDCCSGICQALICSATIGGTCPAGADYCAPQHAIFCNGSITCYCFQSANGTTICADGFYCPSSCEECEAEGGFCGSPDDDCCGGEARTCIIPCPPDGGGCFVGETHIAMADGTSRPVADVRIGDRVLGEDGLVNTVIGIDLPLLGERPLYGFDGGLPFVTGSHPFQTEDGWRAVDPAETYRDHRLPGVGQLTTSHRLMCLSSVLVPMSARFASATGALELRIEPVALASIHSANAAASTQLYNLQLDGNHTYFANDLLVHNK